MRTICMMAVIGAFLAIGVIGSVPSTDCQASFNLLPGQPGTACIKGQDACCSAELLSIPRLSATGMLASCANGEEKDEEKAEEPAEEPPTGPDRTWNIVQSA